MKGYKTQYSELGGTCIKQILEYIQKHNYLTQGFYYGLKRENDSWRIRNGSVFFGLLEDQKISGLALFSSSGMMTCHFESDDVFKKLDFLMSLRQMKPRIIKADVGTIKAVSKVLERIARCRDIELCYMMSATEDTFQPDNSIHGMIVDAALFEVKENAAFLLEVEMAFGRNPLTVNQLVEKIRAMEHYIYYLDEDHIVGQAVIEFENEAYAQLGGVYILPQARNRGIGTRLTSVMTERMLSLGKSVNLLVREENIYAFRAYSHLGFKIVEEVGLMPVEWT